MLEEIIRCDLERELQRRQEEERTPAPEAAVAERTAGQPEAAGQQTVDHSGLIDGQLADVKEKARAIRTEVPDNAYPTVFNGPKWKVFLKRCMRKLTWWFINRLVVLQHWRNEMLSDSVETLAESVRLLEEMVLADRVAQERRLAAAAAERAELEAELREQQARVRRLEAELERSARTHDEAEKALLRRLDQNMTRFDSAVEDVKREYGARIESMEKAERERRAGEQAALEAAEREDIGNYIDYVRFENKFRGSQEEVKSRVQRYLQFFMPGQKVLDLGCGRGEWLETLKAFGVDASGVDINPRCVEMCLVKQLNAAQGDMFAYLEGLEDASLDGVTSLQVIEHITPAQLARLIELCHRKLRTGGVLILETPNPAAVYTMTVNFFVDPTHIRPVHPKWLKYLLENGEFGDVILDYPDYSVIWEAAQAHFLVAENQEDANRRVDFLNNMLFGPTDYAAIARKV